MTGTPAAYASRTTLPAPSCETDGDRTARAPRSSAGTSSGSTVALNSTFFGAAARNRDASGPSPTMSSLASHLLPRIQERRYAFLRRQSAEIHEVLTRPLSWLNRPGEMRLDEDPPARESTFDVLLPHEVADREEEADAAERADRLVQEQ